MGYPATGGGLLNIIDEPREFRQTTFGRLCPGRLEIQIQPDVQHRSPVRANHRPEGWSGPDHEPGHHYRLPPLRAARRSPYRLPRLTFRHNPVRPAATSVPTTTMPRPKTLSPASALPGIRSRMERRRFAAALVSTTWTRSRATSSCSKTRQDRSSFSRASLIKLSASPHYWSQFRSRRRRKRAGEFNG